jgi:cell volume regulation protein A
LGFAEGLAWLSQIELFVLFGLLASPAGLGDALLPALVVGVGPNFVAPSLGPVVRNPLWDTAARAAFVS